MAYRWRLLAVLWFVVAVVVALPSVGSGVLNARMVAELKLDRGVYGAAFGLFLVMMGVPGPLVAAAVRRWGVKPVILIGCTMATAGSLLIATVVDTGLQFALAFGFLVGGGLATAGVLPAQAAVTRWFLDKRALAISIVLSAVDLGGVIAPPLLEGVVSSRGWRSGWLVIAGLTATGLVAAAITLRKESGQELGAIRIEDEADGRGVHKTDRQWTVPEVLRTRAFWLIALFAVTVGLDWILFMAHGVIHLRDIGFASGEAAQAVSIVVLASLFGNLAAGVMGDRVPPHLIAALAMALMFVGLLLGIRPEGEGGLMAFAIPLGAGYGASQVCLMALLGNYFGTRAFAPLFGMLLAVGTATAGVLAGGAGAVFEQLHTYTPVFDFCLVATAIATLAVSQAAPPQSSVSGRR